MPDQPYTIRDGGKMWQHVLDGASVWGVTGPMYDDVGMPCLVVTGDLDAARRRLAPIPADTRTAALDVATAAEGEWRFGVNHDRRNLREAIVDALVAAGLIRPAHDDAAYVAMREEFIRIIDDADSCIHAQPSKESLATTLVRAARAALAAADQEEKP